MGDLPPEVRPLARAAALLAAAALLSGAACGGSGGGSGGGGSSTAAQATGSAAVVADGEIRVLVYGDSLWDRGGDPDRCDLCERLPEDVRITNYARSGA